MVIKTCKVSKITDLTYSSEKKNDISTNFNILFPVLNKLKQ